MFTPSIGLRRIGPTTLTIKMMSMLAILLIFTLYLPSIRSEENGAYLKPTDPVFKVGIDITLECRSPENYNTEYPSVKFIVKHEGKQIAEKVADTAVGDYLTIKHTITDISVMDAGVYTCEIVPEGGEKVSVRTNVYVIEDDELTVFGQAGKETKRSCFRPGQYTDLLLDSYWKVNDKTRPEGDLTIENTADDDAFKSYSCLVTSEKAIEAYGNIDNAKKNGAVTEIKRSLSVINVSKCKDKSRCALIANVYGNTPVNITWVVDRERHSPALVIAENVTSSNISELNVTRSSSVELIVTGGHSIWRESITLEEDKPASEHQTSGDIVWYIIGGIIVGFFALVGLGVGCYCYRKKNCGAKSGDTSGTNILNDTTVTKDEEKGEKDKEKIGLLDVSAASTSDKPATDTPATENGSP